MTPHRNESTLRRAIADEVVDLRWRVLRAGLARELAVFEGDDEPTTRHIVAEIDGKIVGCATVLQRPWNGRPAWQVRGMAVEPELRGSGIGAKLLDKIDQIVRTEGHSTQLWCNARTPVIEFYRRHGWEVASEPFEVAHAGPHVKMARSLT
ncbi:MAG: GNAT family N-acetyltransferase [Tepidisphaeraceae bacterium]